VAGRRPVAPFAAPDFHAVSDDPALYIPAGEVDAVKRLVDAVSPIMGRRIKIRGAVLGTDLFQGLADGLTDEISEIVAYVDQQTEAAKAKGQCNIGSTMAGNQLVKLMAIRERIHGYEAMLGTELVQPAKDAATALEARLRVLNDTVVLDMA
jgi:hypothetical protein